MEFVSFGGIAMFRLTAKFSVQLSSGNMLVCRDLTEEFRYKAKIKNFDVEICLNPDFQRYRDQKKHSQSEIKEAPYFGLSRILVFVTGEEKVAPPSVDSFQYFEKCKPAYRETAWSAIDCTIRYFKYRLHNPLLSTPNQYSQSLQNPSWFDSTGQELKVGGSTGVGYRLPDLASFGIKCLSNSGDLNLEEALVKPVEPELHEELLADAQTAIYENNLRRGALEMAIACEVAVKQFFFAKSSIAGEAYEYLERKRKVAVSIPELIDGAANQAFGISFKTAHSLEFESINCLFQCRNKIAHRGEAWYRDKHGTRHELNRETLARWWNAIDVLLNWLSVQSEDKEKDVI